MEPLCRLKQIDLFENSLYVYRFSTCETVIRRDTLFSTQIKREPIDHLRNIPDLLFRSSLPKEVKQTLSNYELHEPNAIG